MASSKKAAVPASFDLDTIISNLPRVPDVVNTPNQYNGGLDESSIGDNGSGDLDGNNREVDLSKYMEIPLSEVKSIPIKSYIRYANKDGVIKTGARLNSIIKSPKGETMLKLSKYNRGANKHMSWSVKLDTISKIYKLVQEEYKTQQSRPSQQQQQPRSSQQQQQSQLDLVNREEPPKSKDAAIIDQIGGRLLFEQSNDLLKNKVEALENDVRKLDADLKKVFVLVKRLYDAQL